MTDFDTVDYFTDPSLVPDPHPYFDHLRSKNPVGCPISNGVLAVTLPKKEQAKPRQIKVAVKA